MARNLFGGSSDDYAADTNGRALPNRRIRFYTSAAMTTEITDLASDATGTGAPLTVSTDAHGFWGPVYGPDTVTVMYAGAADGAGNPPTYAVAIYTHTPPAGGVTTFNARAGAVTLSKADVTGTALAAADVGAQNVVVHGSTTGTARPAGATVVHWIGSVTPTNAATNDEWTDTANKLLKRWTGTVWDSLGSAASVGLATLTAPIYLPHRMGANIAPENTMPALRAMLGLGFQSLNVDCMALADGGVGVMHDTTIDRTTTASGSALAQTALSWQNLTVDAPSWFGGSWSNTYPPLLSEVLNAAGGHAVLVLETMTDPAATPLLAELNRRGLKSSVIVGSRSLSALSVLAAAGYRCLFIADDNTTSAATIVAAGYTDVGFQGNLVTAAQVDPYIAAGLNVHIYTLTRQSNVAKFAGKSIYMFHCDEPMYCSGQTALYRSTTDRFATGQWDHGMVPSTQNQPFTAGQDFPGWNGPENVGGLSNRGYMANGRWGMSNTGAVLQGWASPIASAAGSGSITFTVTFDAITVDTARYAMVYFGCPDDGSFLHTNLAASNNGYYALVRGNGNIELYKIVNGVQTQLGSTVITAAVGNGGTITVKASWTPTTVTWERTSGTTGVIGPISDTTFRGGYWHLGMTNNSGAGNIKISFGGVTIV